MNNIMSKKSKIAVFADDKEIKKYFDEEKKYVAGDTFKQMGYNESISKTTEEMIYARKKLILLEVKKAKEFLIQQQAYLKDLDTDLKAKFIEQYNEFKEIVGITRAIHFSNLYCSAYKNIQDQVYSHLFPDELQKIALNTLIAKAKKDIDQKE